MEKGRDNISAETLGELLEKLSAYYGCRFRKEIFVHGALSENVLILINGRAIEHLAGLKTKLSADDEISIFPRIAGG